MAPLPPISCICPTTASRRWCLPLAIRWFQRQTYPDAELVVVFDGEGEIADLVPDEPNIRLVRAPDGLSLGQKHNFAVEQAEHDWLAKWDDDDWHGPTRLSQTMEQIRAAGAEVGGTGDLLVHEWTGERRTFRYEYILPKPWLAGQTAVFKRSLWERVPFPDRPSGVDVAWIWDALGPAKGHAEYVKFRAPIYVLSEWGQKVGRKNWNPKPPEYVRCPGSIVRNLMGADYDLFREAFRKRRA